jgi:hypothetical protein
VERAYAGPRVKLLRRPLTIALTCIVAAGVLAFAGDSTTIRLAPTFPYHESHVAFSGELIEVQLAPDWTPPVSSDRSVVQPLGSRYFMAAKPGRASISAVTIRCDRCGMATILWRVDVEVRLPGT